MPAIAGFEVILSLDEPPVSETSAMLTTGAARVEREAQRRRPGVAGEVGLGRGQRVRAVGQPIGVKLQAPVASAVVCRGASCRLP